MSDFLHEQMARKMFENYESPIERICREVIADRVEQEENALVYRVSMEVGYNINKEKLIKALQYDRNQYQKGFEDCARSMQLEQTEWIPVSERLPESSGVYIVTREFTDGFECADLVDACYFDGTGTWHNDNRINHGREYVDKKIKAWMPLPKEYKAESEDKE